MEEDIFKHMQKIRKQMDAAFESFFSKPKMLSFPTMKQELAGFKEPLSKITVKGSKVFAKFKMPGMEMKDIVLNVCPDFIELKAEKKEESREEKKGLVTQKKSFSGFYRKLPLPMPVDPKKAESHFSNGVLEIMMPKSSERSKGRLGTPVTKAEVKRIAKK